MVHTHKGPAFFFKQCHHAVHKFHRGNNGNVDDGLFDINNIAVRGEVGRVINDFIARIIRRIGQGGKFLRMRFSRRKFNVINHIGAGGNQR